MYVQIVFPLPFRNSFTYSVPANLKKDIEVGVRVVVPFGRRVLTGFVIGLNDSLDENSAGITDSSKIKVVKDILDSQPIFDSRMLEFYAWMSDYYLCSLGEALKTIVPYGTDVESKRKIVSDVEICSSLLSEEKNKNSLRAKILAVLSEKELINISYLQKIIKNKNVYSVLRELENRGAITILNEIEDAKVRVKKVRYVKLALPRDTIYDLMPEIERTAPKQMVILLELLSSLKDKPAAEILKKTGSSSSALNSLASKGIVEIYEKEVERTFKENYAEEMKQIVLSADQQKAVETIKNSKGKFEVFLLHGVTGSGKTQVYIEAAEDVVKSGKNVIILVPEISLTPQITTRFYNKFKDKIAVFHSRMSLGERYDTWRGILSGKYNIIIGPRSALFVPLKNIGLIVVDEEHDQSYKQSDMIPKYNARDAAVMYGKFIDSPVVLGSATPSVESMYNAQTGKYRLIELPERIDNAKLPDIKLVDVTIERKKKKLEGIFSEILLDEIGRRLEKKENVIILQNRRGFATQVYCDDCGNVITCTDCSVSMVHHISKNILQCHYCGNSMPVPKSCPVCGSVALKFFGTGTQRVEDELAFYFPNAKIERVDSDSISKKGALSEILNDFRNGRIDILVGTQMVSKGLDFSNVTLVGVVSAETSLWIPDFRADERTFQLLTQVSGRAGRSDKKGEVIIQTQNSKNFIFQKVIENDYFGFYNEELKLRRKGEYPPFTRIALVEIKDENEKKAHAAANDFHKYLMRYKNIIEISPPNEAIIFKIKGFYRYQILVRSFRSQDPAGKKIRTALFDSLTEFNRLSHHKNVILSIDIDPQSIL
ncbi:primosomal protein N' [Melioribacter sp. OK-6-Me]|uniref:primosomal protein N' n=1 Tax=unclassified Melioribacter TaxID=2627329 RepID=UPI003ED9F1F6